MNTATVKQLQEELKYLDKSQLITLCLRLSKFKKENKELLSYLLFEQNNEQQFITNIEAELDALFKTINTNSFFT